MKKRLRQPDGRCFSFLKRINGRVWHIGWELSGYYPDPAILLCKGEVFDYFDVEPDLPDGGRLCANCAAELERRTNRMMLRASSS